MALGWIGVPAAEQARFAAHARPLLLGAGVLLYLLSVAFHYVLLAADARRDAERREGEARELAGQAELRALKAQLNPHFLFNSLNSISALTAADPAGARQMCVLLGDFLRRTLGLGERNAIPLGDELSLCRCFLAVEQVRFGTRLRVEEEIDKDAERCLVPALVLQPLVENAVKHGVANLPEGGFVRVEARRADNHLWLSVENAFDPECQSRGSGGVGLANVRRRLETRYGEQASLRISTVEDRYRVRISLPLEEK
jgi:LytS/YehU family sensor histidine kinase